MFPPRRPNWSSFFPGHDGEWKKKTWRNAVEVRTSTGAPRQQQLEEIAPAGRTDLALVDSNRCTPAGCATHHEPELASSSQNRPQGLRGSSKHRQHDFLSSVLPVPAATQERADVNRAWTT